MSFTARDLDTLLEHTGQQPQNPVRHQLRYEEFDLKSLPVNVREELKQLHFDVLQYAPFVHFEELHFVVLQIDLFFFALRSLSIVELKHGMIEEVARQYVALFVIQRTAIHCLLQSQLGLFLLL